MSNVVLLLSLSVALLAPSGQATLLPASSPMSGTWYCQGLRGQPVVTLTLHEQLERGAEPEAYWQRGEGRVPLNVSMSEQALSGVLLARPYGSLTLRRDPETGQLSGWWQRAGQTELLHCARSMPNQAV